MTLFLEKNDLKVSNNKFRSHCLDKRAIVTSVEGNKLFFSKIATTLPTNVLENDNLVFLRH